MKYSTKSALKKARARISGRTLEIGASEGSTQILARPGGWWILEHKDAAGKISRTRIRAKQAGTRFYAQIEGSTYAGEWLASHAGGAQGSGPEHDLTAQFPGKVRKILVQTGASVQENDPLLLIEAMKMEFSIKAPKAGKIRKMLVQEGQQLEPGTLLVDFEAEVDKGSRK